MQPQQIKISTNKIQKEIITAVCKAVTLHIKVINSGFVRMIMLEKGWVKHKLGAYEKVL